MISTPGGAARRSGASTSKNFFNIVKQSYLENDFSALPGSWINAPLIKDNTEILLFQYEVMNIPTATADINVPETELCRDCHQILGSWIWVV